ncbi:MAG: ATP-binding protein [Bacteroidetes bacterium]|nr:MAG: ATP-binding protein [Bacteroidota bacterium]
MKKIYRYPGSKPFTEEYSSLFFGRDEDIDNLCKYINVENLMVLYGKSGLGKSSLLSAGVMPALEKQRGYEFISFRFNNYQVNSGLTPLQIVMDKLHSEGSYTSFLDKINERAIALWHYFKDRELSKNEPKKLLLVFDQFEEIFTYPKGIQEFAEQLSDLINNRMPRSFKKLLDKKLDQDENFFTDDQMDLINSPMNVKVLISIRADKLNLLNELKNYIPSILTNTYELCPLNRKQAELAITRPSVVEDEIFSSQTFEYSKTALNEILNFLTKNNTQLVETTHLQILCQYFERLILADSGKNTIDSLDVSDIAYIVENYYEWQISEICNTDEEKNRTRTLIEEGLIYEKEQQRVSLFAGQINSNFGISDELLKKLVDSHLIRGDSGSAGGIYYELSHDSLVSPILKARKKRLAEVERRAEQIKRENEEKKRKEEMEQKLEERQKVTKLQAEKNKRQLLSYIVVLLAALLIALGSSLFFMGEKNKELTQKDIKNKQLMDSLHMALGQVNQITDQLDEMYKTDKGAFKLKIDSLKTTIDKITEESLRINNSVAQSKNLKHRLDSLERNVVRWETTYKRFREELAKIDKEYDKEYRTAKDNRELLEKTTQIIRKYKDVLKQH